MSNKSNYLALGVKGLALAVYLGLTIATCAGVWNGNREAFAVWASILLLIVNVAAVVYIGKHLNVDTPAKKTED